MPCPFCSKNHEFTYETALKSLAATPRRLESLLRGTSGSRSSRRPAPDKWSAKEIVCHLADCELVYGVRFRKILSEKNVVLARFDQDAWSERFHKKESLKDSLAILRLLRAAHIRLLKSATPPDRAKAAVHPDYGRMSIRQIVVHLADHDRNHLAQIAARLGK